MSKAPKFSTQSDRDFVTALTHNVNDYFKNNNISRYANWEMVAKTLTYLLLWSGSYALLYLGGFDLGFQYLTWAVLGFSIAMVTVNVGHDAIHGAYSSKKIVNQLLSHTFNLNGASAYMWIKMHNIAHHTYTNVEGYDEDISPIPVLRLSPRGKLFPMHKYQVFYFWAFYGLATFSWVFIKDYVKFFKNEVGNYTNSEHPKDEYFYLFFYKFLNYSIFLIAPLVFLPQPWYHIIGGFLLMHFVAGFCLAVIFMLAHAVEQAEFPMPDDQGIIQTNWYVHQLHTTADFAPKSYLAGFFTGGLNTQVEHHLFPNICSIHYRNLSDIVRKTAEEYNHPYYQCSFGEAIKSHFDFLKKMGEINLLETEKKSNTTTVPEYAS